MVRNLKEINIKDLNPEREFLQSYFWASFKNENGFTSRAFSFDFLEKNYSFLLLLRKLPMGGQLAYIPRFPNMSFLSYAFSKYVAPFIPLEELAEELKDFFPKDCVFVSIEPAFSVSLDEKNLLLRNIDFSLTKKENHPDIQDLALDKSKFKKGTDIQVPDTIVLDISPSMDEILGKMHKKTRYNINLSFKKDLELIIDNDRLEDFYNIFEITSKRDSIAVHTFEYYKSLFENAKKTNMDIELLLASSEGQVLACIVVLYFKDKATYLYGASSNEKRNLMPTYFLQYHAMKRAKEKGCLIYDMFGFSPNSNPENKMFGLYRFKSSFGGEAVHYIGVWDYPIKEVEYNILSLALKGREYYYKKIKKRK